MSLHNEELLNERTNISIVLVLEAWQTKTKKKCILNIMKMPKTAIFTKNISSRKIALSTFISGWYLDTNIFEADKFHHS